MQMSLAESYELVREQIQRNPDAPLADRIGRLYAAMTLAGAVFRESGDRRWLEISTELAKEIASLRKQEVAEVPTTTTTTLAPTAQTIKVEVVGTVKTAATQAGKQEAKWDRLPETEQGDDNPELKPYPAAGQLKSDDAIEFKDIAGLRDVKRKIEQSVVKPWLYPNLIKGQTKQKVFLWYGVPGTGKTTMAEAVISAIKDGNEPLYRTAEEVRALDENQYIGDDAAKNITGFRKTYYPDEKRVPKVLLFNIRNADITSKFVGEPSRKLKRAFDMARQCAPSILFLDECESYLDPEDDNNASTITTFKQEQGGFGTRGQDTMTIMATNYPLKIEGAIRSRAAGGDFEIVIPDRKARKKIMCTAVREQFKLPVKKKELQRQAGVLSFLTAPPSWKVDNPGVIPAELEKLDISPEKRAEIEQRVLQAENIYSGRDVYNIAKNAAQYSQERVLEGRVRACGPEETEDICNKIGETLTPELRASGYYVYDAAGPLLVENLNQQQRERVVQTFIDDDDIANAFIEFKPSVSLKDIWQQMQFNAMRGDMGDSQFDLYWQQKLADQGLETRGACHTVPDS